MESRSAISRSDVPYYGQIANFEAALPELAERFLKFEALGYEISAVKRELSELRREPPSFDELAERTRASYERYRARLVNDVSKYLEAMAPHPDQLESWERRVLDRLQGYSPPDVIESALELLRERGYKGLPADEKAKETVKLEKRIRKLEAEREELLPKEKYFVDNGHGRAYWPEIFFTAWRELQRYTSDACCFRGIQLSHASPPVKAAHAALNLHELRNPKARLCAFEPPPRIA